MTAADRAERRAARRLLWDDQVKAQLWADWGIEPAGPDLPQLLDDSFNANRSPDHTSQLIGRTYGLQAPSTSRHATKDGWPL